MPDYDPDPLSAPNRPQVKDPAIITLPNVRLSFPHLFTAHAMEEGQEQKFSAAFLFDNTEHATLLDRIEAITDRLILDEFKKKITIKRCLRDGNEKPELEGYGDGVSFLSASSKIRPVVVDRLRNPLVESDGKMYPGCYVNATIRLWVQNNQWGKRVNAALRGVQFVKDGTSFGAAPVDATQEFEIIDGEPYSGRSRSGAGKPINLDEF